MKTCIKCGEDKPLDTFPTRTGGRLRGECRPCRDAYQRAYHAANRDRHRDRCAAWYQANKDAHRETARAWATAHPEVGRERVNRRRARRNAAEVVPFSYTEMLAYWEARGLSGCTYCPGGDFEHADHVIPLARGGAHALENLVPACARCNQSKGAQLLDEWLPGHQRRLSVASA